MWVRPEGSRGHQQPYSLAARAPESQEKSWASILFCSILLPHLLYFVRFFSLSYNPCVIKSTNPRCPTPWIFIFVSTRHAGLTTDFAGIGSGSEWASPLSHSAPRRCPWTLPRLQIKVLGTGRPGPGLCTESSWKTSQQRSQQRHCEVGNTKDTPSSDFSMVTGHVTGQEALPSQKHTMCPAGLSQQIHQGLALLARGQDIPTKPSGAAGLRDRLRHQQQGPSSPQGQASQVPLADPTD